jgi:hypothetical protein
MFKLFSTLLLCIFAFAQTDSDTPTWKEIRKVLDYKDGGAAAILYETRLTSKVVDAEATNDITTIKKDSTASVWMKYLLPKNISEERFTLVISRGPIPVKTATLKIALKSNNGTLSYRTWRSHKFTKTGSYSAKIYFEESLVKEIKFTVTE